MHGEPRRQMHKGARWLLAVATVAAGVGLYSSAAAAAATHGTVHVWVSPGKGAVQSIVLTGVIGDHGTATSMDKNGKIDKNGAYVKVALTQGSFQVNAVALNKSLNRMQPTIDKTSCSAWGSGSGNVTLSKGTGAYAGINGAIRMTTSFAAVFPGIRPARRRGSAILDRTLLPWASLRAR